MVLSAAHTSCPAVELFVSYLHLTPVLLSALPQAWTLLEEPKISFCFHAAAKPSTTGTLPDK
jgi:hypothetical protein